MTKDDLLKNKEEIQKLLKQAEAIENLISESLQLTEEEKDWVFEFIYNTYSLDDYGEMVEKNVDKIFSDRQKS